MSRSTALWWPAVVVVATIGGSGGCSPVADRAAAGKLPGTAGTSAGIVGHDDGAGGSGSDGRICTSPPASPVVARLEGDRLYEGLPCGDLVIIDVSEPQRPTQAGLFRAGGAVTELIVRGTTALLFDERPTVPAGAPSPLAPTQVTTTVRALDVTDAGDVRELGSVPVPGRVSASRVVGDTLFVFAQDLVDAEPPPGSLSDGAPISRVVSIDLRAPGTIMRVDELPLPQGDLLHSTLVASTEGRLFVGSWNEGGSSSLQVVDISDPAGRLSLGAAVQTRASLAPSSGRLVTEQAGVLHVIGQTLESVVVEGFDVVSSSNLVPRGSLDLTPSRPMVASTIDQSRGLAVIDTANGTSGDGLAVIALTDPAGIEKVGELRLDGLVMLRMDQVGEQLITTGTLFGSPPADRPAGSGNPNSAVALSLIDLSAPSAPRVQAQVEFGAAWAAPHGDLGTLSLDRPDGTKLLLVPYTDLPSADAPSDQARTHGQLVAWNGTALSVKGSFPIPDMASILTRDDSIYVLDSAGISVRNVADPMAPQLLSVLTF